MWKIYTRGILSIEMTQAGHYAHNMSKYTFLVPRYVGERSRHSTVMQIYIKTFGKYNRDKLRDAAVVHAEHRQLSNSNVFPQTLTPRIHVTDVEIFPHFSFQMKFLYQIRHCSRISGVFS